MSLRTGNWTSLNTTTARKSCFHFTEAHFDRIGGSPTPYVITSVLNAVFSVTAFCGNGLILRSIWKTTSLRLPSKLLIFNLALTDFATGLIAQPLFAAFTAEKAKGINSNDLCVVRLSFHLVSSFLASVSILTLTAIGLDRYAAVRFPYKYSNILKVKRVIPVVVTFWFVSGLGTSTWILKNALFYPFYIAALCFCLLLTSFAYISIYRGLRQQEKTIKKDLGIAMNQRIQVLNMRHSRKSMTGMLYVYCLLLICYLPYLFTNTVIRVTGTSVLKQTLLDFAGTVFMMNSSLNPFVYCWRLREVRSAVWETLRGWNLCA